MNRNRFLIGVVCTLALLAPVFAQKGSSQQHDNHQTKASAQSAPDEAIRGEKVFQQNCSRCHNAPQGFPPQISGTIVRHMRVRASLSAADERAILRFLNP